MNQTTTNIQEQEAHKNRIRWIDALRGFTMFLVVFGHVLFFSFDTQTDTIAASFFVTFRMPMFFFISGFIGIRRKAFVFKHGTVPNHHTRADCRRNYSPLLAV